MPTYEYACNNCGYKFEQFQSITAATLKKCGQCGKMSLKRLIGAGAGVIFKGSGFYQNDYRTESYKKDAEKAKVTPATACEKCPASEGCAKQKSEKKAAAKKL